MSDKPPTVLVVDDEPCVLDVLGRALRASGLTALLAGSGEEAVALLRQHLGAIDVVLLDVQMPNMDGPATLAAIRATDHAVPCCFMSGHSRAYTVTQLLGMGAVRVLAKPFRDLGELASLLREVAGAESRP